MGGGHEAAPKRLHGSAFWLLGRAARRAEQVTLDRLEQAGMRRYFYGVLATLDEFGSAAQAEIGRRIGLDPSDMVAVLNELVELGHVRRERDPDDRRRNRVELTESGVRELAEYDAAIAAADADFLSRLPAADRRTLTELLRRLILPDG